MRPNDRPAYLGIGLLGLVRHNSLLMLGGKLVCNQGDTCFFWNISKDKKVIECEM